MCKKYEMQVLSFFFYVKKVWPIIIYRRITEVYGKELNVTYKMA